MAHWGKMLVDKAGDLSSIPPQQLHSPDLVSVNTHTHTNNKNTNKKIKG